MDALREPGDGVAVGDPYVDMLLGLVSVAQRWRSLIEAVAPPPDALDALPERAENAGVYALMGLVALSLRVESQLERAAVESPVRPVEREPDVRAPEPLPPLREWLR